MIDVVLGKKMDTGNKVFCIYVILILLAIIVSDT